MNQPNYKSFLWPPDHLLSKMRDRGVWTMLVIPSLGSMPDSSAPGSEHNLNEEYTSLTVPGLEHFVAQFIERTQNIELREMTWLTIPWWGQFCQYAFNGASQLIRNAYRYGNKGESRKLIHLGVWLGDKGIILGCRDEGDFFSGLQDGTDLKSMYPHCDFAESCLEQNAVFVGFNYNIKK